LNQTITAVVVGSAGLLVSSAHAGVQSYTDRAAWELVAGPLSFSEDFESFQTDIDFSFGTISDPMGFSLSHTGQDDFRNLIDVGPLDFSDGNGTNSISAFVDGDGGDVVTLTADSSLLAFGFDVSSAAGGEGASLELLGLGGTVLDSVTLTNGIDDFFGFTASGPDVITGVRISGMGDGSVGPGEGFRIDNVAGTMIPAPGAAAIFGVGGLIASRRRRRS
jgi:hypothetical protein